MEQTTSKQVPMSPWKKPNEVMALHRLKKRKKQLDNRIENRSEPTPTHVRRRNIFSKIVDEPASKRFKDNSFDTSNDSTLFKLINNATYGSERITKDINEASKCLPNITQQYAKYTKLAEATTVAVEDEKLQGFDYLPIDWTLKTKLRILTKSKLNWASKLKASDEASGLSAFVRCLESSQQVSGSLSAQFHQCCLYWQHPAFPWLQLFPRVTDGVNKDASVFNGNDTMLKTIRATWIESFRSLFQLLRTKQCPYFYVCASTFVVLFRAAGVCGWNELNASVSVTTRGFRSLLKDDEIEFVMPLKKSNDAAKTNGCDVGFDASVGDSAIDCGDDTTPDDDDVDEETWLASLGVDAAEIKKINTRQTRGRHLANAELSIDNTHQSHVVMLGAEAQAFFNFLINLKTLIPTTGPLAGVPPTLLAPVAFHEATLKSLNTRHNRIRVDQEEYTSVELKGPIMPHALHQLVELLDLKMDDFTVSFDHVTQTRTFGEVKRCAVEKNAAMDNVFNVTNLRDCGLCANVLKQFCSGDDRVHVVESLKWFKDDQLYTWT